MQHDSDMSYTELDAVSSSRVQVCEGLAVLAWIALFVLIWAAVPA